MLSPTLFSHLPYGHFVYKKTAKRPLQSRSINMTGSEILEWPPRKRRIVGFVSVSSKRNYRVLRIRSIGVPKNFMDILQFCMIYLTFI